MRPWWLEQCEHNHVKKSIYEVKKTYKRNRLYVFFFNIWWWKLCEHNQNVKFYNIYLYINGWNILVKTTQTNHGTEETKSIYSNCFKFHKLNRRRRKAIYPVVTGPNDLTIPLTLSAKALEVIFFPGTWKGLETASTYAAWNLLKNWS